MILRKSEAGKGHALLEPLHILTPQTKQTGTPGTKKKFSPKWSESLLVKLNYKLSNSTINSINSYYMSMGRKWAAHNTHQSIGRT